MSHELYEQLQQVYDYFNRELFNSRLPRCLITVQRENDSIHGYFSERRFGSKHKADQATDEIAMNPIYFVNERLENVLATLVHEMVHLEQAHFGKPGRGRYHNQEWGDLMKRVGLMPSHTGEEGGKQTGDQMTHYIMQDGPFDVACHRLLSTGFGLSWYDKRIFSSPSCIKKVALEPVNYGKRPSLQAVADAPQAPGGEALKKTIEGLADDAEDPHDPNIDEPVSPIPPPVEKRNKTVYQCPQCKAKVWGRPNLLLKCGLCDDVEYEMLG